MPRLTAPLVLVLAAAIAGGGCGGGDDNATTTAAPTPTVTTLTTAPAVPSSGSAALDKAVKLLRAGAYKVVQLDVNPPAIAARKVGDHVLLYAYKTPAAAKDGAGVIKAAIGAHPKRGVLDTEGSLVYFFGDVQDLSAAERASFADLVDVGQGRTSP